MRLLSFQDDGSLAFTDYIKEKIPPYAILSHKWNSVDEEVTYQDMSHNEGTQKRGYRKIKFCAAEAAKDGLKYFWVDTCCIDKSRPEELTEAINSMFQWYQNATKCYVYLSDVSAAIDEVHQLSFPRQWEVEMRESEWFRRGWTLQELLAPESVTFYSYEGTKLGDKRSLRRLIREVTGIPDSALQNEPLANFTLGERLSWALGRRQTSRNEDFAYCLLGILDISMPIMYGEGTHAFVRLQNYLLESSIKQERLIHGQDQIINSLPKSWSPSPPDYAPESMCMPGTRVELLRDILQWAREPHERNIFWITGRAGSGKSTIMRTVARSLHQQDLLGGTFFFWSAHDGADRADDLVATLAAQLAFNVPHTKRYICDAISAQKDPWKRSLREQFNDLIVKPLSILKRGNLPLVMMIDGLDECVDDTPVLELLRLLPSLQMLDSARLRLCLSSRPNMHIRQELHSIPEEHRQFVSLDDIPPSLARRDISLYIRNRLASMNNRECARTKDWPIEKAITTLVEKAHGLFLWASLACRYTSRVNPTLDECRIDELPCSLDGMYTMMLRKSMVLDVDVAKPMTMPLQMRAGLIRTLSLLFLPLSTRSLANLMDVEPQAIMTLLSSVEMAVEMPLDHTQPINFVHRTFREFLLEKTRSSDADFWVNEQDAHMAIAHYCLQHLSKVLPSDINHHSTPDAPESKDDQNQGKLRSSPELQYACLYWVEHLRRSGRGLRKGDYASHFLETQCSQWTEAIRAMRGPIKAKNIFETCSSLFLQGSRSDFVPPSTMPFEDHSARASGRTNSNTLQWRIDPQAVEIPILDSVWDISSRSSDDNGPVGWTTPDGGDTDENSVGRSEVYDMSLQDVLKEDEGVPYSDGPLDNDLEEANCHDSKAWRSAPAIASHETVLPLRIHETRFPTSHTAGQDHRTSSMMEGGGKSVSGSRRKGIRHTGSSGSANEGTVDSNQENDGNGDQAGAGAKESHGDSQAALLPCPCIGPEDGLCQGNEANISTMRRRLRSWHQFYDCERCWDAFENKARWESHDCLRCEPCCIAGDCDLSGDTIATRKHPRDKWKCPNAPKKLEAVEYWHFAIYGVTASARFVFCEQKVEHSISRRSQVRCAPVKILRFLLQSMLAIKFAMQPTK